MRFAWRWHLYKITGLTVLAMLVLYAYALARNPNAADGDPFFWILLGVAGALFVAWNADTAVRQMRRAAR